MKDALLFSLFVAFFAANLSAQNINIPDANFKKALLENTLINTNNDGEIQVSEAATYSGIIDVASNQIKDLTGIEAFVIVEQIYCPENQLTSLDVSKNKALTKLDCYDNQLTSLDISKNSKIVSLICFKNQLINLNLKNGANAAIYYMYASNNPLLKCIEVDDLNKKGPNWEKDIDAVYSVDCSVPFVKISDVEFKNVLLDDTLINTNKDDKIQVSEAIAYSGAIYVPFRNIKDLTGIEAFVNIKGLFCQFNQLKKLDISKNIALTDLSVGNNALTTFDISKNKSLVNLYCYGNQLVSLNLKNGANNKLNVFRGEDNKSLKCIQVDDPNKLGKLWEKDITATYSANCSIVSTEDATIIQSIFIHPNPANTQISITLANVNDTKAMVLTDLSGRIVQNIAILPNTDSYNFDVTNIQQGLYLLQVQNNAGTIAVQKINIIH